MAKNIFTKGQRVTLQSRVGLSPRTPMDFTVLMRLPDNQGKAQYRIRNEEHGHERVEQGSNLELMASVSSH
ncbi:hypothetical protein [Hoeflea sp. EC-HK425]|jgi:hypothetical protein|uniref:hypothetical protein n=1 Tax=Hoeflea sp. EC-HK425 TaxID=2038388 RepID=UPI00125A206B|nr:hypothetical protein [Hoeflea sp. EC-HK425]VVT12900.1 conserved hypothetical protein [Hoeflea sp. EC-HK425]|tara:strand:+ start:1438 stop:1650 length:213 start_codon:yes stop_codon:yes gene_type:complete